MWGQEQGTVLSGRQWSCRAGRAGGHEDPMAQGTCSYPQLPSCWCTLSADSNLKCLQSWSHLCVTSLPVTALPPHCHRHHKRFCCSPSWHVREAFTPCSSLPSILDPDTGFGTDAAWAALGLLAGLVVSFFLPKVLKDFLTKSCAMWVTWISENTWVWARQSVLMCSKEEKCKGNYYSIYSITFHIEICVSVFEFFSIKPPMIIEEPTC